MNIIMMIMAMSITMILVITTFLTSCWFGVLQFRILGCGALG